MKIVSNAEEIINPSVLKSGSKIYVSGNAATPQLLLGRIASDDSVRDIEIYSVLLLGDVQKVFSEECCKRITHRIIFNGPHSREAVNKGLARYQMMHLSDIPRQLREYIPLDCALISVSGPDNGGNFSLGCTVEGIMGAIDSVKKNRGLILAERNAQMPFVLGTTIHESNIDFLIDSDLDLPLSPVNPPDERALKIGRIISELYVVEGSTLQFGIGELPEAVADAVIEKGVRDLGVHTELFADAMRKLVDKGVVTNKRKNSCRNFCVSSIFLSGNREGYEWLNFNSSVQSRPSDFTNNILNIAAQPKMISINGAIGVDLHGNIWADSLAGRNIYSGVGGQSDFIRGAYLSSGGAAIIALKSTTDKGRSKIVDQCPTGITTTAIPADPVIIVTEYGAFDPRGLSITEHAVGTAFLAGPTIREKLLKHIYDSNVFNNPQKAFQKGLPKGFTPYEKI